MTNIEKSEKFDLISDENANQIIILPVGQLSVKITLPCGCSQVQHPLEMQCGLDYLTGGKRSAESISVRSQFFEFCNTHK